MLPARKGGLENVSKSPPGRTLGVDHPFAELLFLRISFRDPRNLLFQIRFVFGFSGCRDSLGEACNHEGTGGGRQLLGGCHPCQLLVYACQT